jgi:hypothetical protein
MTEQEWLECADPQSMLESLRHKVSDRKFRLFAVAWCRKFWHLLHDQRSRLAVEEAERHADGEAKPSERIAALNGVMFHWTNDYPGEFEKIYYQVTEDDRPPTARLVAEAAMRALVEEQGENSAAGTIRCALQVPPNEQGTARAVVAALFREICHNSFHPVVTNHTWFSSTVVSLAQAIYDERAFDRLPILADALEDASCTNAEILNHCRHPGDHARGCWVLDLLLDKQ